jgi:hypothetical protein
MTRRRIYAFAELAVGDRLVVPLNGRAPDAVQHSVRQAAWNYRKRYDAGFGFLSSITLVPGFVVLERIEGGDTKRFLDDRSLAGLARWASRVERHGADARVRQSINRMRQRMERRAA